MTSFFPDLNIWLALSFEGHSHAGDAWEWLTSLSRERRVFFCRYTQMGLLRLLTASTVMGERVLTMRQAWAAYDQMISDPRVEFLPEPRRTEATYREATAPFADTPATKCVGDCYLAAFAREAGATLVTFDRALAGHAKSLGCRVVMPGGPATAR